MPAIQSLRPVRRIGCKSLAIAAIATPVIGIRIGAARGTYIRADSNVTDAMRPGVVRIYADPGAQAFLDRQNHSVVTGSATRFKLIDEGQSASLIRGWIPQEREAPLVGIRGRIASSGYAGRTGPNRAGYTRRRIELHTHPQMRGLGSQVGGRNQPVLSELVLHRKVPGEDRSCLCVWLLCD